MGPSAPPDPVDVAVAFVHVLESLGIPYLIGGSFASSVHGEPRSTNDVDVLADFRMDHVEPFVRTIRDEYYVSETAMRGAIRSGASFNVIHMDAAVKVDVFIVGGDPFDRERLEHRARISLTSDRSTTVCVDTAEHSVLRKLEWFRRGGEVSERQWRDVVSMLRIQGERLDAVRLERWAERLGVADLLERARQQAVSSG